MDKQVLVKYKQNDFIGFYQAIANYFDQNCHVKTTIPDLELPQNQIPELTLFSSDQSDTPPSDFVIVLNKTLFTNIGTTKSLISAIEIAYQKLCMGKSVGIDLKSIEQKTDVTGLFFQLMQFLNSKDSNCLILFLYHLRILVNPTVELQIVPKKSLDNVEIDLDFSDSFLLKENLITHYHLIDLGEKSLKSILSKYVTSNPENKSIALAFTGIDKLCQKLDLPYSDIMFVLDSLRTGIPFDLKRCLPLFNFFKALLVWAKLPNHIVVPFLEIPDGVNNRSQLYEVIESYHQEHDEDVTIPEAIAVQLYWFFLFSDYESLD